MKLDNNEEQSTQSVVMKKKQETNLSNTSSNSILDLLNPLKSININSDLHSFYNFRKAKESVDALLKAQQNLVFYVLHQNFMCDEAHKEFFKNMVGRFYDLPKRFWDYYRGYDYCNNSNYPTMIGLVLLENKQLYENYINLDLSIQNKTFKRIKSERENKGIKYFNAICLKEYWGIESSLAAARYFIPSNRNLFTANGSVSDRVNYSEISFENEYEYGRFSVDQCFTSGINNSRINNCWFKTSQEWLENSTFEDNELENLTNHLGIYASLGIENIDDTFNFFKLKAKQQNTEWNDEWNSVMNDSSKKIIHSLSQRFDWTKDYIINNEELLNLDVLGLNMTVPWNMELVKFFVKKGFGGRMSENKAVFDKVFKPLLTDEILEMLFKLEYEKY